MLLELINSTLEDVSRKQIIGVDALQGILDRNMACDADWNAIERLEGIGIDEIALKKGHRDFVVVISAYVNGTLQVICLLGERTKAAVAQFFGSIPKRLRHTVRVVCSDLYQGFIGAAKAVFGNACSFVRTAFISPSSIARGSRHCVNANGNACVVRSPKRN